MTCRRHHTLLKRIKGVQPRRTLSDLTGVLAVLLRQYVFDGLIARQLANVSAPDKEAARRLAQPFAIKLIQSR